MCTRPERERACAVVSPPPPIPFFLKKGEFQKVEVRSIGENDTERLKSSKMEK